MLVMSMNAGSAQASAAPLRARRAASSAKFLAQACNMRKKPHMKMLTPRYFPDWEALKQEVGWESPS